MRKNNLLNYIFAGALVLMPSISAFPKGKALVVEVKGDMISTVPEIIKSKISKSAGYDRIEVFVTPGNYHYTNTLVFDSKLQKQIKLPISFSVKGKGKATFSGGTVIDLSKSSVVSSDSRINPIAKGKIISVPISSPEAKKILMDPQSNMSMNGRMMTLSRYPNVGFAHIDKIVETGAIYAHGRSIGDPPQSSASNPIGGCFTVRDKDISSWEKEMQFSQKAKISGYLSYDWYRETHPIASISEGKIKLTDYSRYGVLNKEKIPRRFVITNILCELDSPGEFYFDEKSGNLLLWPYESSGSKNELTLWSGNPFVELSDFSNVKFENFIIECVSKGNAAVDINNCNNVELAGCVIRNCSKPAVIINKSNNCGILSCDIYDVPQHIILAGGDLKNLTPAKNYAINCHFTQTQYNLYGKIALEGVGQIFKHNLIHNFVGQIMTLGGSSHLVEGNELFNIGIEEGDGGAIYQGAQMYSWGNLFKQNFLHHLMCIPQAHPRGGIYPDDGDQGDIIEDNVFYKAAHRAVLINGGGGHTVNSNIFLNGYIGIYNVAGDAQHTYQLQKEYDSGKLKRGDKTDYIWKTEQAIGKEGWNSKAWKEKFPKFAKIMNQEVRRFLPIECEAKDNCFCGNKYPTQFVTKDAKGKRLEIPFEKVDYFVTSGNHDISMDIFANPSNLDFSYKSKDVAAKMPNTDFKNIGLYVDKYRNSVPDKNVYRHEVYNHFLNRKSFDEKAVYNTKTINNESYFNTGKLILGLYSL